MADEKINLLASMTVKEGNEEAFITASQATIRAVRAEEEGCLNYTLYRRKDNPREFVFFEQYRDTEALQQHFARLVARFGPPAQEGQLPAGMQKLLDKSELTFYDEITV